MRKVDLATAETRTRWRAWRGPEGDLAASVLARGAVAGRRVPLPSGFGPYLDFTGAESGFSQYYRHRPLAAAGELESAL